MKTSDKAQEVSHFIAQTIAKIEEWHSIVESTIKESCCAIIRTTFGHEFEIEVNKIRLADCRFGWWHWAANERKNFLDNKHVCIVSEFAQLMAFIRFIDNGRIIER